jgi:RHH-type transcriptional regulator, rel operon repressor / antitoxin RelB
MARSTTLTVRLSAEQVARLSALAEATNRTRSFLAAEAIEAFLAVEEWQVEAIREGLADLDATPAVDHERVGAWLRSWGTGAELPTPE